MRSHIPFPWRVASLPLLFGTDHATFITHGLLVCILELRSVSFVYSSYSYMWSMLTLSSLILQKESPSEEPTLSAHPARFSPDDKFSKHRIICKKRFNLLPTQQPPHTYWYLYLEKSFCQGMLYVAWSSKYSLLQFSKSWQSWALYHSTEVAIHYTQFYFLERLD